jgi:hypothetical protein
LRPNGTGVLPWGEGTALSKHLLIVSVGVCAAVGANKFIDHGERLFSERRQVARPSYTDTTNRPRRRGCANGAVARQQSFLVELQSDLRP